MSTTRRTVLAALPVVAFPDFSAPAPVARRVEDDAELIALCIEHRRLWHLMDSDDLPDADSDAVSWEAARICRDIARITPKTQLGLAWKARVVALENGFEERLACRDVKPFECLSDMMLFLLLSDVMTMAGAGIGA